MKTAGPLAVFVALACAPVTPALTRSAYQADPPVELGAVAWLRDHAEAVAAAADSDHPILILFQEIPGCATCRNFGGGPLSHPLLVEAIETEFVPLAVYNNRGGDDRTVLERYDEPSWNNPVVRFFAPSGDELLPRGDHVWTEGVLAARMVAALEAAGRRVPPYLALIAEETDTHAPLERAVFSMACFWHGEGQLGALAGVRSTRAAWLEGREVVELQFDPRRIEFAALLRQAQARGVADYVFATTAEQLETARRLVGANARLTKKEPRRAKAADQLHGLEHTSYRYLPLTELQATRMNAAVKGHGKPQELLSPRQSELYRGVEALLARDPQALAGWVRPERVAKLAEYELRLRRVVNEGVSE